jgi:hypothetical protein
LIFALVRHLIMGYSFQGMDAFIGDDQEENIMQVRPTDSVQAQLQKVQDAIAAAKREAARKRAELV